MLQSHVDTAGLVDYEGFLHDSVAVNAYLYTLETHLPNDSWSKEEQLAYWINAYNAYTIRLVLDHYPVESIKDIKKGISFINSVWDIRFIPIGEKKMTLNRIEHGILRKRFEESRIHYAIVCASMSCPPLRNEAFVAERLDAQLTAQAKRFINDSSRNRISSNTLELSKIYAWFGKDFEKNGSLQAHISRYADVEIQPDAEVRYLDYNWKLNKQ